MNVSDQMDSSKCSLGHSNCSLDSLKPLFSSSTNQANQPKKSPAITSNTRQREEMAEAYDSLIELGNILSKCDINATEKTRENAKEIEGYVELFKLIRHMDSESSNKCNNSNEKQTSNEKKSKSKE